MTKADLKTYPITKFSKLIGVSYPAVRRSIARGEIPVVQFGRRLRVPASVLVDLMRPRAASEFFEARKRRGGRPRKNEVA